MAGNLRYLYFCRRNWHRIHACILTVLLCSCCISYSLYVKNIIDDDDVDVEVDADEEDVVDSTA